MRQTRGSCGCRSSTEAILLDWTASRRLHTQRCRSVGVCVCVCAKAFGAVALVPRVFGSQGKSIFNIYCAVSVVCRAALDRQTLFKFIVCIVCIVVAAAAADVLLTVEWSTIFVASGTRTHRTTHKRTTPPRRRLGTTMCSRL